MDKEVLGDLITIDYSWGEIRFESDRMPVAGDLGCKEDARFDIEPDDLEVSDSVTVEWEIW